MKIAKLALAAAALVAFPAQSAFAQEIDPVRIARVADRPAVSLDPAKAYLLVESNGALQANFLLSPTDEQRADWARQRSEALAEAIQRHPRLMSRYEREMEVYRSPEGRGFRRPEPPVLPTEETFSWPDLESRLQIVTGPMNRFFSEAGVSLWLYEVPAGTYTFYSTGMPGMGDCACMGSVSFEVPIGQVTGLRIGTQMVDGQGNPITARPEAANSNDLVIRTAMLVEPISPAAFDPRLPRDRIRTAQFAPVERLPNWVGSTINRVSPIPGVMSYDRGRVVDERGSGQSAD